MTCSMANLTVIARIAAQLGKVASQMREDGCSDDMIQRMYRRELLGLPPDWQDDLAAYLDGEF